MNLQIVIYGIFILWLGNTWKGIKNMLLWFRKFIITYWKSVYSHPKENQECRLLVFGYSPCFLHPSNHLLIISIQRLTMTPAVTAAKKFIITSIMRIHLLHIASGWVINRVYHGINRCASQLDDKFVPCFSHEK